MAKYWEDGLVSMIIITTILNLTLRLFITPAKQKKTTTKKKMFSKYSACLELDVLF